MAVGHALPVPHLGFLGFHVHHAPKSASPSQYPISQPCPENKPETLNEFPPGLQPTKSDLKIYVAT